jgi:hypothetical protein
MEALTNLLSAIGDVLTPVFEFLVWIFPFKIYRIHDGEKGVIKTFGKVREKRWFGHPERDPGITLCTAFEEMIIIQAKGGYIDLLQQVLMTNDDKMTVINGAVEYEVLKVKESLLEVEDIEMLLTGFCMNMIREYAKDHSLDQLVESDKLTQDLATKVNYKIKKYGCRITKFMITDLRPHDVALVCDTLKSLIKIDNDKLQQLTDVISNKFIPEPNKENR